VTSLFERAAEALDQARSGDAFGSTPGAEPEPEPTALAAIALDDEPARRWVAGAQRGDGSFGLTAGPVENDSATGLAALALPPGPERESALDHVVTTPARKVPAYSVVPHDPSLAGWGWASGTAGWVEPTARALLAIRLLRPQATGAIEDAVRSSRIASPWTAVGTMATGSSTTWRCSFGQTTAVALIGLQDRTPARRARSRGWALRRLWPVGAATSPGDVAGAFRLLELADTEEVEDVLERSMNRPVPDVIALGWIALASGPGLLELAVTS
jgi:hypothetical protein